MENIMSNKFGMKNTTAITSGSESSLETDEFAKSIGNLDGSILKSSEPVVGVAEKVSIEKTKDNGLGNIFGKTITPGSEKQEINKSLDNQNIMRNGLGSINMFPKTSNYEIYGGIKML